MRSFVLDAGPLIAGARNDRLAWAWKKETALRGIVPIVPAPVLAQVWRDPPAPNLARYLRGTRIEPLTEELAREAGALLGATATTDIVDATVVALAVRVGASIMTGDVLDIKRLVDAAKRSVPVRQL